jgi:hypothetical protein
LHRGCQARLLIFGLGGEPEIEQRANRNDQPRRGRGAGNRLGVEVPDGLVAEPIGVRIAGEQIVGNVLGKVPGFVAQREGQVNRGQIAGMACARADYDRDEIALLDANFDRFDLRLLGPLRDAGGQTLAG